MQKFRNIMKSAIAMLLALLTVVTPLEAEAKAGVNSVTEANWSKDSAVAWTTELPIETDFNYKSDKYWHRLVLEYGDYCTNSIDSNGDYVDITTEKDSAWPDAPWNGNGQAVRMSQMDGISVANWLGDDSTFEFERVTYGTKIREQDQALYANGEYSTDGMYSLYIKYAGKSHDTNEDCWYISPCDANGNREQKLWALECCMNMTGSDVNKSYVNHNFTNQMKFMDENSDPESWVTGIKPVCEGPAPTFNLVAPTYYEFENLDNFKYAGIATNYYHYRQYKSNDYEKNWQRGNNGTLKADYHDNHKWIITQNTDGSWSIKSAGYCEWDWAATAGDWVKMFNNPEDTLVQAIAGYIRALGYGQISGKKNRSSSGKEYAILEKYYIVPWAAKTWAFYPPQHTATHLVPMLWLDDYVSNVYIVGNFEAWGTEGFDANGRTKRSRSDGKLTAACYMKCVNNYTAAEYDDLLDTDINDAFYTYWEEYTGGYDFKAYYCNSYSEAYKKLGIKAVKEDGTCYTTAEIKDMIKINFESAYTPSAGEGAFTGLYVGTALNTQQYAASESKITIAKDQTVSLGEADNNNDGTCDSAAFIGNLDGYAPNITIEQGGTLQIDGPTYAANYTTIRVKGELYINSGAFLATKNGYLELYIEGGTVYIAPDAMLDVGSRGIEITDGGTLVNDGFFVNGMSSDSTDRYPNLIVMRGGTIENGSTGWIISGADVVNDMRMTLMRNVKNNPDLANLLNYISNVYDDYLSEYDPAYDNVSWGTLRMYNPNKAENTFKNFGNAFICGAVKGQTDECNLYINRGNLYNGRDAYSNSDIEIKGASFTYHADIINKATGEERDLYKNTTLNTYYSFKNIEMTTVIPDEEGSTKCLEYNIYALRIGTGSTGTDRIGSIKITYIGKDGRTYTANVNPEDKSGTYEFVKNCSYCGTSQTVSGDSKLRTHGGTSDVLSAQEFTDELEPYTNLTYIVQLVYPLEYVESISVIGGTGTTWSCTELNFYRVEYLYPIEEYAWSSTEWYIPFSGELIAEVPLEKDSSGISGEVYNFDSETLDFGTGLRRLNVYGVPGSVSSKRDSTGYIYYNASTETKAYSTVQNEYVFSVSLADNSNAGIESLYNVSAELSLNDLMNDTVWRKKLLDGTGIYMQLYYIDTNGSMHKVTMPFALNAVEWAYYNMTESSKNENLHGLFQQGEDIAYQGILPDFAKLYECYIQYTDEDSGGTIAVTAASLSNPATVEAAVEDGILKVNYPDTAAISFFCASDTNGVYVNNGQLMSISMKDWNGTENLKPKAKGSKYLVVVETDEMSDAATLHDVKVQFTYQTIIGGTATTDTYNLRTAVNDYYGYWLSADGTNAECAYTTAVAVNQKMYFVLDIVNLYKFTSATFSIDGDSISTAATTDADSTETSAATDSGDSTDSEDSAYEDYNTTGRDEWQMSAITIYELSELGKREVLLGQGTSFAGVTTNRTYYRDNKYGSRGVINSGKGPLMVIPGGSNTIIFEEGGGSTITGGGSTSKNKATGITSLRYEDTKQDFGFTEKRTKYLVTVKVKGNAIDSVEYGDCGSKNQFYFQLIFQDDDGNTYESPCVLSNQQLQSDGFRTGTEEEFAIYTNDDYGTPVQINIIPDDTSSVSDVFDKLCIDYITVSKTSGTGVNLSWKASDVGWIDIEYKDEGEEQTGRTSEELMRSFELKDDGYKVWIEFGIETDAEYIGDRQFQGQVTADIIYRDSTGSVKTKPTVAVVGKIADYAERSTEVATTAEGAEISDTAYMFRKGYTNRFLVQFNDISTLVSIKLTVTPENDSALNVNKIFARQVFDEGVLSLNRFNEYQHIYSVDPNDLTSTTNTSAVKIEASGVSASHTFTFASGNSIIIKDDEEVEVNEGDTEGKYDSVSVTAELTDITGIDTSATLPVKVIYKNIYGDACAVSAELVYDAANNVYMIPANSLPSTPDIGLAYQVEVTGGALAGRELKVVKVNQVRDGNSYKEVVFAPTEGTILTAEVPVTITIPDSQMDEYAKEKGYTSETQKIYLKLGSLTKRTLLSESQDVEIALVYTEKSDPYQFEKESEYVSVMDSGYALLNSGTVICVPMNVGSVGSIKGIRIRTTDGTMTVNAEKGCISVEETNNLSGGKLSSGWVNLPSSTAIFSSSGTRMNSDGQSLTDALKNSRLSPINITAQMSRIGRSDAKVRIKLYYKDTAGTTQSISSEMSAGDWNSTGAWFITEGIDTPQYYTIEAYDSDATNIASVTISSINVSWYSTSGELLSSTCSSSITVTEGVSVTNSLITTKLTGNVSSSEGQLQLEQNLVSEGSTSYGTLTLSGNRAISVYASLPGFKGELKVTVKNETTGQTEFSGTADPSSESLSCSYTLPVNTGTANVRYSITVESATFPQQYAAKVYVEVAPSLYIQGASYNADGTIINAINSYGMASDDIAVFGGIAPGGTVTIYARTVNDTNGLTYSLNTADSTAFTVNVTEGCTLSGYTGTFTRYEITAGTTVEPVYATFIVSSVTNSGISYGLRFATVATGTTET